MLINKQDISPEMLFKCCQCGGYISGQDVLDGALVYVIKKNKEDISKSTFKCDYCQNKIDDLSDDY